MALQGHVDIKESWIPVGFQSSNMCLIRYAPIKPGRAGAWQREGGIPLVRTVQLFECSPSAPSICLYI